MFQPPPTRGWNSSVVRGRADTRASGHGDDPCGPRMDVLSLDALQAEAAAVGAHRSAKRSPGRRGSTIPLTGRCQDTAATATLPVNPRSSKPEEIMAMPGGAPGGCHEVSSRRAANLRGTSTTWCGLPVGSQTRQDCCPYRRRRSQSGRAPGNAGRGGEPSLTLRNLGGDITDQFRSIEAAARCGSLHGRTARRRRRIAGRSRGTLRGLSDAQQRSVTCRRCWCCRDHSRGNRRRAGDGGARPPDPPGDRVVAGGVRRRCRCGFDSGVGLGRTGPARDRRRPPGPPKPASP